MFAIGAALGFMTASYVFGILNTDTMPIVLIASAVLGGILAAVLQKPMLILATAFGGAYAAVAGISYLISKNFDPLDPEFLNTLGEDQLYRMAIIWFGLGVFGLVVQLMTLPRKGELATGDEEARGEGEAPGEPDRED